ncbi:hypothetical protein JOC85_002888 [Bacillus mesophilus]|uniref:DUF3900 domain-containing protein n=1 Tax=Bacillus mesophilus TaxID=1808955 RepID=A0A6M0Q8A4_9BACI|nr:DUF3900 domain-containing protein [Bacillus mesophilus]MBM7662081.1 hypothetical protein [Bacillus mesophilus]NEY72564.1 DUF3900 domain-containing protein [Bacillus mesophilus]
MDFQINYLSFYVVQVEGQGELSQKSYKHFKTLDSDSYEYSTLKDFLDGELAKIVKRKVERHPKTEKVPTKLGYFITAEGHELDSNPNYNLFQRVRFADSVEKFKDEGEKFVVAYTEASAVREGVFIIATAKLNQYFDNPFVFIMKCDFEPKVASISDETTLIRNVEMAITTKNMKSIQYPYMPEEGMIEESEVKLHQSSHARYFEDFLKYVEYRESMPEIVKSQVLGMVQQHIDESYDPDSEDREKFESAMEVWATSPKRELQERFTTEQVMEASSQIIEHTPEIGLSLKLDHIQVKGMLSDFGESVHIAKINGRFLILIEGDSVVFEKGYTPLELLKPEALHDVIEKIENKTNRNSE